MSQLTKLEQQMIDEAKDATPTWKIDPYEGRIKKQKVDFKSNQEIQEYLDEITSQFTQNEDIDKMPILALKDTLKKQIDRRYQVDTLQKLDFIDNTLMNSNITISNP